MVEIAKVLSLQPRIVILDEPTAPLTGAEADTLFGILRTLREQGVGIIYITHRFKEVLALCDRGTVLRSGRVVTVFESGEMTLDRLVEATLGQQSDVIFQRSAQPERGTAEPVLSVRNLTIGTRVRDVSFTVSRGEIVGICGLLGAGQSDIGRALFGDREGVTGTVEVNGQPAVLRSPHVARRLGIGFLSDSRREEGIFPDMPTAENVNIASLSRFVLSKLLPIVRKRPLRRRTAEVAGSTNVAPSALGRPVRLLSGGNQQKAMLSRWLMRDADVFVFLEPTIGVDVGAKFEVYRQLEALADAGKSILVISTDISEILGLSDRIIVMYHGAIAAVLDRAGASEERVVLAMQGMDASGRDGGSSDATPTPPAGIRTGRTGGPEDMEIDHHGSTHTPS
jgi:ABC-type sugar transport system ATPase subunit